MYCAGSKVNLLLLLWPTHLIELIPFETKYK